MILKNYDSILEAIFSKKKIFFFFTIALVIFIVLFLTISQKKSEKFYNQALVVIHNDSLTHEQKQNITDKSLLQLASLKYDDSSIDISSISKTS